MHSLKVLFITFLSLACSLGALARSANGTISITNVTVKSVMPGDLSQWSAIPNGLALTARTNGSNEGAHSRLVVRIKSDDGRVCGNITATAIAIAPFSTKTFSATELLKPLSDCGKLSEGRYSICFQFFNEAAEAICAEECREFSVERPANSPAYTPPANIAPADNQLVVAEEAKRPIRFEWTPVSPLPEGQVSYRLRVWPMKEGQTKTQAISANKPIVTKTVIGVTTTTLNNELPMPCEPPYTCHYTWNVQALDVLGNPIGDNDGTSQPSALMLADYIIRIKDIKVACTATPGIYSFSYTIQNINPGTAKLTNLVVTSSVPAGAAITAFAPPLNTNIVSGGTLTITGTVTASSSLSFICIGAEITDVANTFWKASRDTCIPVLPCKCEACDPKKVNIVINPTSSIVLNANNTLTMTQPITVTTTPLKLVKSVKAELQYFEFLPANEECMPCNEDDKTFGNMDNGSLAGEWGAGTGTHALQWIYSPAKNFSTAQNAVITITLPPSAKCCATIRWCIRYVITFSDCTVCSKIVCYEKKKTGCTNGGPNPNNN